MSTRCKPGDLAVVLYSDIPENVGLFVDVIEADDPNKHGIALLHDGQVWICRARGAITYRNIFGEVCILKEGPIPDEVLKPIRPDPIGADTETEKELETA